MYLIKRHKYGLSIKEEKQVKMIPTSLQKYLNQLCLFHMSTYEGRVKAARTLLSEKKSVPIYINDKTILYATKSIRDYNTVIVNYFAVLSIKKVSNTQTRLIFINLDEEIVECSYQKIMKRHSQIKIIIGYLNNQSF